VRSTDRGSVSVTGMPALPLRPMPNPASSSARSPSISHELTPSLDDSGGVSERRGVTRGLLLASGLVLLGSLLAACGGSSASDNAREAPPPPPTGGETAAATAAPTSEATPAPSATAAADDSGLFRIGEVTPAVEPQAAAVASAAPQDPASRAKEKPKHALTSPLPAGADPNARGASGGKGEKANDEGGHEAPKPPAAAVVDSNGNLSEAEVRATIVSKQSTFRECYDLGASGGSSFSGTVQLKVSIGATGAVVSVDVLTSTTKNAQVDSCVTQAVRRIQFPAKGNGAVVAFPIEFGR